MGDTKISWASKTWNLTAGCTKVSAGCQRCYAARLVATRLAHLPHNEYLAEKTADGYDWTGPVNLRPEQLQEPLRWRKPERVFVCSQSDLFHEQVPPAYIARVFDLIWRTPQHTYIILTKRPERMRDVLIDWYQQGTGRDPRRDQDFMTHLWAGVSVENQQAANERIPLLLQTPAAVRFVSCEPLLDSLDLSGWLASGLSQDGYHWLGPGIEWVIAGSESGPGARWAHLDWFRSLRDQCLAAGVPYFLKQTAPRPGYGAELDGKTWHQFPQEVPA